jgi:phosphonate transport system substrate-binding protein
MMLDRAGARCSETSLERCRALSSVRFTGGHDATALAVSGGRVDAGGLELRVLHRLERAGTVPPRSLRVVGSLEVMGYPWVGRTQLGAGPLDRVRKAFLALSDPELLDLLRAEDYVAVTPADYEEVRREAQRLGLLR